MMHWRSRLSCAVRAWLACAALFVAVPAVSASADARPIAACVATELAPNREGSACARRLRRTGHRPGSAAPEHGGLPVRELPAPSTQAPRVLVPRLYLRLLSIRC